ncbi:MAG: hypothetical protein ACOY17_08815, partial [Pseudomonadota bacterium]
MTEEAPLGLRFGNTGDAGEHFEDVADHHRLQTLQQCRDLRPAAGRRLDLGPQQAGLAIGAL